MVHAIFFKQGKCEVISREHISKNEWAAISEENEVSLLIENQQDLNDARTMNPDLGYDFDFAPIREAAKKIKDFV